MSASDLAVSLLTRLQAKINEMPLMFAAFATIVYFMVIVYYRGETRKVITIFGSSSLRLMYLRNIA